MSDECAQLVVGEPRDVETSKFRDRFIHGPSFRARFLHSKGFDLENPTEVIGDFSGADAQAPRPCVINDLGSLLFG